MVAFPNSKINLGLNVISKRDDGFHDIETCFYPLPWCDVLEIIPAQTISFRNTGIPVPGRQEENLCLRAYYLLRDKFNLPPVDIHLHKIVPMGAGLGGGSADAAFTLMLLNSLFELKIPRDELTVLATTLGSDCAYFIYNEPMIGSGRGEILKPCSMSLKGKYVVVIKPNIHISTAEAFRALKPQQPKRAIENIVLKYPIEDWRNNITNDFETTVFEQHPQIKEVKRNLYDKGALYASMSGSGSSVFGIFNLPVDLKDFFKDMNYWSGAM